MNERYTRKNSHYTSTDFSLASNSVFEGMIIEAQRTCLTLSTYSLQFHTAKRSQF